MPDGCRHCSITVMLWLQSVILLTVLFMLPLTYWIAFESGVREGKNEVYEQCTVTPRAYPLYGGYVGPAPPAQR